MQSIFHSCMTRISLRVDGENLLSKLEVDVGIVRITLCCLGLAV